MDNAGHTPPAETGAVDAEAHIVSYDGGYQQALLDLDEWVKDGTPPPASSHYSVTSDTQVQLPATAAERLGVQPVVSLEANGAVRADVAVGKNVTFTVTAQVPPDTGKLVKVEWDFKGAGDFPDTVELDHPSSTVSLEAKSAFSAPGTYFAVVRVTSQRNGTAETPYTQVQNLARARVVVQEDGRIPE
jgi:hypothetical protein